MLKQSEPGLASVSRAKWAFTTRRVRRQDVAALTHDVEAAAPGDLILAEVTTIGHHRRIQAPEGRPVALYPGDLIVMPCGARYAPDQFEGVASIGAEGADMLAGGGCIGSMTARHGAARTPTRLRPLARLLGSGGAPINLARYALPTRTFAHSIPVIAVLGASMNSGKTTAAAALVRGLGLGGWRVAGLKGTGTGAFGDYNKITDAGACFVADFTDAGLATTYLEPIARVGGAIETLLAAAELAGAEVAVLEIADGLLQRETAALIRDAELRRMIDHVVFACADPLSALGGVGLLSELGLRPEAVTGAVSASPMSTEEAERATGVPVLTQADLCDPAEANRFAFRRSAARAA